MATRKGINTKRRATEVATSRPYNAVNSVRGVAAPLRESAVRALQTGGATPKDAPKIAPKSSAKTNKHAPLPEGIASTTAMTPLTQLPLAFTVVRPTAVLPVVRAMRPEHVSEPLLANIPAEEEEATTPTSELPLPTQMSVRRKFGELRAAIADGFEIQEPIYARPLWSSTDNSRVAYSFVLQRESLTRLITVPGGRTVQQFIRERDLQVDYRQ